MRVRIWRGARLLALVLFGLPLAVAAISRTFAGDPFAMSIAIGFVALIALQNFVAHMASRPAPRKADPAKIARLERELQIGLRERAEESADERGYTGEVRERWIAGYMADGEREVPGRPARNIVVDTEAPTTIVQPYAGPPHLAGWPGEHERHCPRPAACVAAHGCRVCGARHREPCRFHGAPTFGHKIAKPSGPPRKPSDASRSARP